MPVLLIFMKGCRLEKALDVDKRTFKGMKDDTGKGKHDIFTCSTWLGGLRER